MNKLMLCTAVVLLTACGEKHASESPAPASTASPTPAAQSSATAEPAPGALAAILAAQDEAAQARYQWRHPQQTLEFFGLQPGMTVLEALPGGGWYSKILLPYLGSAGLLIGVDYATDMWSNFPFADEAFIAERGNWPQKFETEAKTWAGASGAPAIAYTFATLPDTLSESVDAVLFIRALHNLARFENKGQFLSRALAETHRVLKPGGLVGVVQHQAPEEKSDEWADGSRGYIKKSLLIKIMDAAGFTLIKESSINENPSDQPGDDDIVWRLPPSFSTSKDDPQLQAQYRAIGESNRMTLLFKKR